MRGRGCVPVHNSSSVRCYLSMATQQRGFKYNLSMATVVMASELLILLINAVPLFFHVSLKIFLHSWVRGSMFKLKGVAGCYIVPKTLLSELGQAAPNVNLPRHSVKQR